MLNYLKSSISISSYDGCTIGCKYCILSVLGERNTVRKISKEEELVEKLVNFKLYTKTIPISVNNQTDPFLNKEVFESTIKILTIMEDKKLSNPILIITKGYLNDDEIQQLSKIQLNIIILYTFSGLSETLENRKEAKQIETMKKLSKLENIKLINYYRPVIEGINTNEDTIERVASIVTKYCRASIESQSIITEDDFKKILDKIRKDAKFEIKEHYIKIEGTYWQEEVSYMRHITKKNIKADKLLKRTDEFLISQ